MICRQCGTLQIPSRQEDGVRCASPLCGEPICVHCGCTEKTACFVSQPQSLSRAPDFCCFVAPGLCSNPECIKAAYYALTPDEILAAQLYYDNLAEFQRGPQIPLTELKNDLPENESTIVSLILNHLLTTDQANTLARLDIDAFDLIHGHYPMTASQVVAEIFADWNEAIGRDYFRQDTDSQARAKSRRKARRRK